MYVKYAISHSIDYTPNYRNVFDSAFPQNDMVADVISVPHRLCSVSLYRVNFIDL